jgi:VanZ like family
MRAILKRPTEGRSAATAHYAETLLLRLARIATWTAIVAIAILSLLPGSVRPHTGFPRQAEHFIAYAFTGFASSFAYLSFRERVVVWAGLGAASGFFELLQAWIPGRSADLGDVFVSIIGATAGLMLGAILAALIIKR